MKRAPTWRNMFLLRRISGPRPHTAKSTIVTAGTNLSTTVLPCKALHDLQNIRMLSKLNFMKIVNKLLITSEKICAT